MSIGCGSSLFGPSSQYIKVNAGDFVAVNGSNTSEKLSLSDLRMPFKQILKSRVILKPGQANYLLNHLGIGDNATFLLIKATYDPKSVIQDDNYVDWSFYDSIGTTNQFAQTMLLTGNTTHRVKQIYLTNPNTKYAVYLDIMVAVIDDNYSFFNDNINQSATSFTDLEYVDIHSHVVGDAENGIPGSIVINDKSTPVRPLIYFTIYNINSIERNGKILTIDDNALSTILLSFKTEADAIQAHSLFTYAVENPDVNIDGLSIDSSDPVLYFYSKVNNSATASYIILNGATSSNGFNSSQGSTFSTALSLLDFGNNYGYIDKSVLFDLLVSTISDNRDGTMSILPSSIIVKDNTETAVTVVAATGSYSMTFDYSDIAQNYLNEVIINLNITA